MKKKIFLLLLGFMMLGIGGIKVAAEDSNNNETIIKWYQNKKGVHRIYKNQAGGIRKASVPDLITTINGEAIFCIEMLDPLVEDYATRTEATGKLIDDSIKNFKEYFSADIKKYKYNNKEYDSKELIELVAYYGNVFYKNGKDANEKEEYYLAAQRLIWEIINEAGIYPRKGLYAGNVSETGHDEKDLVDGKIYLTTDKRNVEDIKEIDASKNVDLSAKEKEIMDLVDKFYASTLPTSLNLKDVNDFKINEDNHKYIEIENKDNEFTDYTFDEKSECQLNDDKSKVICIDSNDDNNINLKLGIVGEKNLYYSGMDDKNDPESFQQNQFLLYGKYLPSKSFEHNFNFIEEEAPVENVIIEEPPVESPPTSDTNIILIVTICLCTLISAIIIYIKKVNLIKNNTI